MARQEVIVIDDDEVEYVPRRRRSRAKAIAVDTNSSDIEIIENPVAVETMRTSKGKGKRKALPHPASNPRKKRSKRVSRGDDERKAQMDADAEMAQRMAMEWDAESSPEPTQPRAGPSTQPSSSHASSSRSVKEVIEVSSTAPTRNPTPRNEISSSGASRSTTPDGSRSQPPLPRQVFVSIALGDVFKAHGGAQALLRRVGAFIETST
ncbi:hypothetical protein NMY22_g3179 [Coprinellus aureogranulatus]|nr:hypothetical protein NMY22_g3179 [Coprinellus aureogranulatus]